MKTKKIFTAIGAVAMATVFTLSAFSGCKKKQEHAYVWTTDYEATCSAAGKETGVCAIHGDVIEREIPLDANAHAYGDWQIKMPTEEAEGSASRVCTLNSAHTAEVTLPKITEEGTGYLSSEITKQPTMFEEGERTFVFGHASGNVVFVQSLKRKKLETVEDAVTLGSLRGELIRSEDVQFTESATNEDIEKFGRVFVEFADDGIYTVVTDNADNAKQYFSYDDDGNVFGIEEKVVAGEDGKPVKSERVMENITENHILGYGYDSGAGNRLRTFGAEQTLKTYYEKGKFGREDRTAVKYSESIEVFTDLSVQATFQFSCYENPNFCRYTIKFSLDTNGVIDSLIVTTEIVRPFMMASDEKGNPLFDEDGDLVFGYDGDLQYGFGHEWIPVRELTYSDRKFKKDTPDLPENPYDSKVRYIKSFSVSYDGNELNDEYVPKVPSLMSINLEISNVLPVTSDLNFDPLRVFVLADREYELSEFGESTNPYGMTGHYNKETGKVSIRANYAGPVTIILRTKGGQAEKKIKIEFEKSAPSTIFGEAYVYSDAGGDPVYNWQTCSTAEENAITIYVGQKLKIRTATSAGEMNYADLSFTASLGDYDPLEPYATFEEIEFEGRDIYTFSASQPNVYQVYVEYIKKGAETGVGKSYTSFFVNVVEPPRTEDILSGVYECEMKYLQLGSSITKQSVTVTFEPTDGHSGKVHITAGDMTSDFNYTFDETTKALTLVFYGGASAETFPTLDFSIEMNEYYKLVLTHTTPFGGEKESKVLSRPKA